jgi:hypothetical protein
VETTRDDGRERNRLCPPNTLPDNPANWAEMLVRGTLAARAYGAEPDIAAWANDCALNPAAVRPSQRDDPAVQPAARLADITEPGLARMAELAGGPLASAAPAGARTALVGLAMVVVEGRDLRGAVRHRDRPRPTLHRMAPLKATAAAR